MSNSKKIGIIDCGISNLGSIVQTVSNVGHNPIIVSDPELISHSSRFIFPGQGNFSEAMRRINHRGWNEALRNEVLDQGKPILGICLGMQLFAKFGNESGRVEGLGFVEGETLELECFDLRLPHIGWNTVYQCRESQLFFGIPQNIDFYFSHSFVLKLNEESIATANCNYGQTFIASLEYQNIFGTQFHPEKSSKAGRQLLKNFCEVEVC
jgi:glutamine amidotransferase